MKLNATSGAWVAQSVKHLTLDLSSDHDLRVHGIEPHVGLCAHSVQPAWDSLSPSLCPSAPLTIHKLKKKKLNVTRPLSLTPLSVLDNGGIFMFSPPFPGCTYRNVTFPEEKGHNLTGLRRQQLTADLSPSGRQQ